MAIIISIRLSHSAGLLKRNTADVEIVITADTSNGQSGNGAVSELVLLM